MALKVLIVEDDRTIAELIEYNLRKEGFETLAVYDGAAAIDAFESWRPELILLDVMLPEINGFDVCKAIRGKSVVPIIMLTAKNEELDRVLGLELGADDYIAKPFSPRELVARIRAVMRRIDMRGPDTGAVWGRTGEERVASPASTPGEDRTGAGSGASGPGQTPAQAPGQAGTGLLRVGRLSVDTERHTVRLGDTSVELTPREFDLLRTLAGSPGKVFTREYLMDALWGYEYMGDTRTVDVHIRRLRKKLPGSDDEPHAILTVHGLGYKMRGMA